WRKCAETSTISTDNQLAVCQGGLDVQLLISSSKWLQLYGLKRNKLSLSQILSQIGFQHREDYVSSLGRPVASRYAAGLFPQYMRAQDGSVYNLTAKKDLILHFVACLMRAIELYKQRMDWLTSASRQIFGVIQEQCVVIVLDFGTACPAEFDLCCDALSMVLTEQVTQIAKFNLIRARAVAWQERLAEVNEENLQDAWLWIKGLEVTWKLIIKNYLHEQPHGVRPDTHLSCQCSLCLWPKAGDFSPKQSGRVCSLPQSHTSLQGTASSFRPVHVSMWTAASPAWDCESVHIYVTCYIC
uniref:VWA3B protein n=1 Tax=Nothoprocta perdicaria TaxID=30464 RepID=A0A8C6YLN9_NOTPE